jgi:thiamine-phosphate pyrophosphorylase
MNLRGLYAITPEPSRCALPLPQAVEQAIQGGARVIQSRDKRQDPVGRRDRAEALLAVCRRHGIPLIINDDLELAAAIAADGVHLGRDDGDPRRARTVLGPGRIIGVSCYNRLENAERARDQGADYVAFGRFFPSNSKPLAVPATPELLQQARAALKLPIVAIGGISPENGGPLVTAGADMLAVIDGLFGQPDIRAAAAAYNRLFTLEEHR